MSEYRWLNGLSQKFAGKDYLLSGQTMDDRITQICQNAERILNKPGFAKRFQENVKKGWHSFSTPVLANFGLDRGLPISCNGSYVDDTMESILDTQTEVGILTKYGAGTSVYLGNLRERGAPIKNNGFSSGPVHFARLFDTVVDVTSQGGVRKGSCAVYLPVEHPDIEEFLEIRSEGHPIQNLSFGVCVSDEFMEKMIEGGKQERRIWAKIINSRINKSYPYIFFTGNANKAAPDVYKDKGMKITHTNLCVTGDQLVVTSEGMKRVIDLYNSGKELTLFDGNNPVKASPMNLIEKDADVYEIEFISGRSHKVTEYHKIKTERGMIKAKDLTKDDKVCFQLNKGMFGKIHDPDKAFLLGMYQGDGTQTNKSIFIDLWENDFDLKNEIEDKISSIYLKNGWLYNGKPIPTFFPQTPSKNGVKKIRIQSAKLKQDGFEKGSVPQWIWDSDEFTQSQYLRGLYFTDGCVNLGSAKSGFSINLSLASTNKKFLQEIQILLSNFGIKSCIYNLNSEGFRNLPDGRGDYQEYWCNSSYRLNITNKPDALFFEKLTGFLTRKGISLENREYRDNIKKYDKIKNIKYLGKEDVYCTTVDTDDHVWVCNSIITSNCTEIFECDTPEETFVCDLGSMIIPYYDEWKDTDAVELYIYFLDAVMTEYIEKAKKIKHMERAVRFAERQRALGLGWMGWHSYLQSKMIPYESMEAKFLNVEIAKNIQKSAMAASVKLAKEYGEPELLKGYGRRNVVTQAIAPTKSSRFIFGQFELGQFSENIEPYLDNYHIDDLAKGKFTFFNPYLKKILEEKGQYTPDVLNSILRNSGSVQHLSFLCQHEKDVFKTFAEISPKEVIIQAAQRQKYIDQGQSLNLMIHQDTSIKDINALYIEAWRMGIKSLYYQYGVNAAQNFAKNILSCTSCEA